VCVCVSVCVCVCVGGGGWVGGCVHGWLAGLRARARATRTAARTASTTRPCGRHTVLGCCWRLCRRCGCCSSDAVRRSTWRVLFARRAGIGFHLAAPFCPPPLTAAVQSITQHFAGVERACRVHFYCGDENRLSTVQETEICKYEIDFSSPFVCSELSLIHHDRPASPSDSEQS
jgi:hypothetical protein